MTQTPQPGLSLDSSVELREVTVVRNPGREPLLGCLEVKAFIEVDDDTLVAIDAIRRTKTLREGEALLLQERAEEFDLLDLATYLRQRGFVRAVDGTPIVNDAVKKGGKTYFGGVPAARVAWMHHKATLFVSLAIVAVAAALVVHDRSLYPGFKDMQLFSRPSLVILTMFVVMMANTYIHELAHLFMARGFGVDSSIRISNRFHILVMETDVTNAWTLPPKRRALIFLAGMGYNAVVASLVIMTLFLAKIGVLHMSPFAIAALRFFGFVNTMPLIFQFFVFMRTDLYFTLLCLTGERNLLGDSKAYVLFRLRRAWLALRGKVRDACASCSGSVHAEDPFCLRCGADRPTQDPSKYPFTHDQRRTLLLYGLFATAATPYMIWMMGKMLFVVQIEMLTTAWNLFRASIGQSPWLVVENALVLCVLLLQVGMLLYMLIPQAWKAVQTVGEKADLRTGRVLAHVVARRVRMEMTLAQRTAAMRLPEMPRVTTRAAFAIAIAGLIALAPAGGGAASTHATEGIDARQLLPAQPVLMGANLHDVQTEAERARSM